MNIMDAMELSQILYQENTLKLQHEKIEKGNQESIKWSVPQYWETLFHNGPINKTLY
jgi:hypothetical protein